MVGEPPYQQARRERLPVGVRLDGMPHYATRLLQLRVVKPRAVDPVEEAGSQPCRNDLSRCSPSSAQAQE
eukprot:8904839-Pyramimonas_sp.AAC.1